MNSFYEKYRPKKFRQFLGHKLIIRSLLNFFKKKNFPSSFIFYGKKGTGKSTLAILFAKSLNCKKSPLICNKCKFCKSFKHKIYDFKNIDSASNRSVEKITELFEDYLYKPIYLKYKVYILDECHALSKYSFNTLLNILENLPRYVKIIFITTEFSKIPETIISRCIKFNFQNIPIIEIYKFLKKVSDLENIKINRRSLLYISSISEGSMRDALNNLEFLFSIFGNKISNTNVINFYNKVNNNISYNIINLVLEKNKKGFILYSKYLLKFDFEEVLKKIIEDINEIIFIKESNILKLPSSIFKKEDLFKKFSVKIFYSLRRFFIKELVNFKYYLYKYYTFITIVLIVINKLEFLL
ncbi:DNA polymerase III subunit gamma/tau [Candidatus Vidania fulgoroideorum]